MKYVKQFLKGGIFCFVCTMVFGFSTNSLRAYTPETKDQCESSKGFCTTVADCGSQNKNIVGTCKESGDLCCYPKIASNDTCTSISCDGSSGKGTCSSSSTCSSDSDQFGMCSEEKACCVPRDCKPVIPAPAGIPTDPGNVNGDVACRAVTCPDKTNGVCLNSSSCDPAGLLKNVGKCDAAGSFCCISKSCSTNPPATTPTTTPSSGTASLNYTPLENLPGFEGESGDFATYFKNLYLLALWIVGISALFMLVVGGFLYLSSAGNTSLVGTAKKTIYGALIGLVIALISWLLLDTINSDLTNLKLSGLSGAVGTGGGGNNGGSGSSGGGSVPDEYKGKGSGCNGIPTQPGIDKQCGDASQNLSDTLKCIADKVGTNNIELSSISDSAGFSKCQNEYNKPPCHHTENSCHYGGHNKNPKSCAADISTKGSSASDSSIVDAAKNKCNAPTAKNEGNHIHVSVSGCSCDYHN